MEVLQMFKSVKSNKNHISKVFLYEEAKID